MLCGVSHHHFYSFRKGFSVIKDVTFNFRDKVTFRQLSGISYNWTEMDLKNDGLTSQSFIILNSLYFDYILPECFEISSNDSDFLWLIVSRRVLKIN